ncbi:Hpt domain-containing protein [uncultured Thiodictyon sp.]|uniref:Hpt domain-containing protein n=1 Tax=uncultured Thiodictyon sp. TaxID=1846217 RepID=UPI0025DC1983|nr:Hpt domain-containing protein [uncultured Thiodictyon sp.]
MEPYPGDQYPSIPGIDSAELMERVGDDLDLFWEVLGEFSDFYRETPTQIAQALEQDPTTARQLAHTLKGVLGNLAAIELFPVCTALHQAIREGHPQDYPPLLATLSAGIPALCDAIAAARDGVVGAPLPDPGPSVDPDWLAQRYAALGAALAGHQARDCKTLAEELAAAALPTAERACCTELQGLIRAYRFQDAQALLEQHLHG